MNYTVSLPAISKKCIAGFIYAFTMVQSWFYCNSINIQNASSATLLIIQDDKKNYIQQNRSLTFEISKGFTVDFPEGGSIKVPDFLEPNDTLEIVVDESFNKLHFKGDKAELYTNIYQQLGKDSLSKLPEYQKFAREKSFCQLVNASELLLSKILEKASLKAIFPMKLDTPEVSATKKTIEYSWLNAIFSSLGTDEIFIKQCLDYYFTKYLHKDTLASDCEIISGYNFMLSMETIVNTGLDKAYGLPEHEVVQASEFDPITKYLSKSC